MPTQIILGKHLASKFSQTLSLIFELTIINNMISYRTVINYISSSISRIFYYQRWSDDIELRLIERLYPRIFK